MHPCNKRLRRDVSDASTHGVEAPRRSELPPGPASLQECFQWPQRMWQTFSSEEKQAFANTVARGINLHTQYSGMGCVEQAFLLMEHALAADVPQVTNVSIEEQCDVSPLCRKVLLAFPASHRAKHLNGDILSRLPDSVRKRLLALQWPVRPAKVVHDSHTKAGEQYAVDLKLWEARVAEVVLEARLILDAFDTMCFHENYTAKCFRHDAMCPVWTRVDERDRFILTVAGTTCLDWTYMGERLGLGGASALPFLVWLREQRKRRVPALLHECTPGFRPEVIKAELPETEYEYQCITISPEATGVPNERIRLFTLVLRRDVYCLDRAFADFATFVKRRRIIDGNQYYIASADIIHSEIAERAVASGMEMTPGFHMSWHDVLGSAKKIRLVGYRERACEVKLTHALKTVTEDHSILNEDLVALTPPVPFLFDLEQTPSGCPRMSTIVPCLLRHGELWNDKPDVQRAFCREEYLSVAGVWTLPAHGVGMDCAFAPLLQRNSEVALSMADCKKLAGNCIHINVIGQMCMWIAAHLVIKPQDSPWSDGPLFASCTEDPEEVG